MVQHLPRLTGDSEGPEVVQHLSRLTLGTRKDPWGIQKAESDQISDQIPAAICKMINLQPYHLLPSTRS